MNMRRLATNRPVIYIEVDFERLNNRGATCRVRDGDIGFLHRFLSIDHLNGIYLGPPQNTGERYGQRTIINLDTIEPFYLCCSIPSSTKDVIVGKRVLPVFNVNIEQP